jgi:hypothetical protein
VQDTTSQEYLGELSLQFATGDRLVLGYDKSTGAPEVIRFDGGETTLRRQPRTASRSTRRCRADHSGTLRVSRRRNGRRLTFANRTSTSSNIRGYDVTADADIPVSASVWFVTGAGSEALRPLQRPRIRGQVFRKEEANILRAGVRGVLAAGRYHAILGYDAAHVSRRHTGRTSTG